LINKIFLEKKMGHFTLGLSDDLREQVNEAAKRANVTVTTFIKEAIKYRLRNQAEDFSSVFKEAVQGYEAPNLWDKMVLIPLLEILYYERLKVDNKTKEEALKKAEDMQRKAINHYDGIKN
jgi:predicted DNA-binding protein